ncbi:SRPBCC domain-containing protein [Ichthyenterobacterium magnum]|uniref:Activator of Hsp90 ATPase-like protein n=1 Tax=Ichthyenterobacterium magnum TaxID=1230530 RepID=A0A420DFZ1_9FLAO|nr:SRPBCC domain-containing protein [Ichthyenterobacterium magnum]RKE91919.1 activator of Hsp90 ATPase-like protein [Ichthyenterobacterium magnum]
MEFTLKTNIKATAKQIYKSWLSTQGHTKMTGGTAFVSDKIGDSFTVWDGYIKGENLELEPYHKIVQSWRSTNFEAQEEDSKIEIIFNEKDGETELTLTHSNVPESGEHYIKGWDEHYFTPMKSYFEFLK